MCESPAEGVGASHDKTFSFFAPPLRASFRQFRNFFAPPLPLVIRPPPSPNYKNLFSHIRNFAKCEKCSLLIFTKNNPAHTKGNNKEATVLISLVSEREGERDDAFLLFHPPSLLPLPPPFNCMHCDAAGKHWIRQIQEYFSNKTYFCITFVRDYRVLCAKICFCEFTIWTWTVHINYYGGHRRAGAGIKFNARRPATNKGK